MDCAPNMPQGNGQRTNILVAVDDFSKFVMLTTLENLTSAEVRRWFERNILYLYGRPN